MKKSVVFCILVLSALIFILMTSNASAYGVDELKKLLEGSKQKNDLFYDWKNSNFNFEYPSEQRIGEIADAENNCVGSCSDGFICYYKHGRCGEVPESYLDIPSNWCNPKTCTLAEQSYYFSSFPPAKADIKSLCQIAEEKIRPNYCKTFQTYETGNAVYCIEKPRTSGRCITYYLATNSKVAGHCTDFGCVPDINEADSDGDGLLAYSATTYKFEPSGIVYTDNKENKYSLKEGMPTNPRTVRWGDCMDNDDRNVRGLNLDDAIASRVDFSLSYVDDTKKTRKFTPSGLVSPFDDIALIFTFPSPANCSFQFNGFGNPIVELSVDGKVLYNYTNLETEEVVDLEHNQIMESLIIRGWSNGQMGIIPDTNKMEQLVDAIVNNKDIVFTVKNATGWAAGWKYVGWNSETNTRKIVGRPIPQKPQQITTKMTNCVHMFGSGKYNIFNLRTVESGTSGLYADVFIQRINFVIQEGFRKLDPFAKYLEGRNSFSHYVDLAAYREKVLENDKNFYCSGLSCSEKALPSTVTYPVIGLNNSYCFHGDKPSVIKFKLSNLLGFYEGSQNIRIDFQTIITYLHEFGHAFADLNDEYNYNPPRTLRENDFLNCRKNQNAFFPSYQGCTNPSYFRSTVSGIMAGCYRLLYRDNSGVVKSISSVGWDKFNVISCIYIVARIGGDTNKCIEMDTIKSTDECIIDYHCQEPKGEGWVCQNRKCVKSQIKK